MSGRKTKTGTRTTRKPARQPSLGLRLIRFLFNSASALALVAGDFVVRNPVLTGGATAFLVVMGFVSANALWYQPEAHNAVFFRTRTDFVFKPTPRASLPGTTSSAATGGKPDETAAAPAAKPEGEAAPQAAEAAAPSPDRLQITGSVDDMLPALAPNADLEVARLQQRLATLGIYKGPVDGFSGPQTREAVERWQGLQKKLGVQQASAAPADVRQPQASGEDDVAKAIDLAVPSPRPQPAVVRKETPARRAPEPAAFQAKPAQEKRPPVVAVSTRTQGGNISSQDIIRVQAGLKAFGNDLVPVDGVPGKTTREAVREFQKLFGMPVTGEIDTTLIGKMREIGLIG